MRLEICARYVPKVESNRNWHLWLFRKDMVWPLSPSEASHPYHITSSFGLHFMPPVLYVWKNWYNSSQGGTQQQKATTSSTKMMSIYRAIIFISNSYIIVTNERSLQNCLYMWTQNIDQWSNKVGKIDWLCCCLTWIQTEQMVGNCYLSTIRLVLYIKKSFVKISSEITENEHTYTSLLFWCARSISEKVKENTRLEMARVI